MQTRRFGFTFVSLNKSGVILSREADEAEEILFDIGAAQPLTMIALPGGEFMMGSPVGEGYEDEKPRHIVKVRPFLIGRFPVTQAQWTAVMGAGKKLRFSGSQKSVHDVTWLEAQEFCRKLTAITSHLFRLPSEAEWEYACRAGSDSAFSCGATITTEFANYNGLFPYLDAPEGEYRHVLLDVGSFPPNPFGLHEMHGNLWEWCADPWHENYEDAPGDSQSWEARGSNSYRVARGGSWHETADLCRSAVRLKLMAADGDEMVGVRVVGEYFS
ncbi:MAG: formylglycine-generating enzyme family protein [Candidatus Promineifilaceae bacterium]|jgi:formylglycine-generating enzyme required for sulfatase activity